MALSMVAGLGYGMVPANVTLKVTVRNIRLRNPWNST